jgi:uncharacterized membrane protein
MVMRLVGEAVRRRRLAVSWRATGSTDTSIVAFVITGNPKIAGSVAVTENVTKILIYYLHERVWAFIPWGKR